MEPEDLDIYVSKIQQMRGTYREPANPITWGMDPETSAVADMLVDVLDYLDTHGGLEFAILKNPKIGEFWKRVCDIRDHDRKKSVATEKLYAALTEEERKILGIRV